jgi:hypothetical protein
LLTRRACGAASLMVRCVIIIYGVTNMTQHKKQCVGREKGTGDRLCTLWLEMVCHWLGQTSAESPGMKCSTCMSQRIYGNSCECFEKSFNSSIQHNGSDAFGVDFLLNSFKANIDPFQRPLVHFLWDWTLADVNHTQNTKTEWISHARPLWSMDTARCFAQFQSIHSAHHSHDN